VLWSRGLVGSWRLENSALDGSGNGNNGTLHGTPPSYVAGPIGQCLSLNGAGDYVDFNALDLTSALTICAWVKTGTISGNFAFVLSNRSSAGNGYELLLRNGSTYPDCTFYFQTCNGGTEKTVNATASATSNTTYFLAATYNGSVGKLYVNGVLQTGANDIGASAIGSSSEKLNFARRPNVNNYWGRGLLDEVHIWNRALSAQDIRRVMMGLHPIS